MNIKLAWREWAGLVYVLHRRFNLGQLKLPTTMQYGHVKVDTH